jgi:hypothetical protein
MECISCMVIRVCVVLRVEISKNFVGKSISFRNALNISLFLYVGDSSN